MDPKLQSQRVCSYAIHNFNFGIYYDKIYKKEYLPTRIRYNQFFFFAAFFGGCAMLMNKQRKGGMFCKMDERDPELANRKYYTSDRACVNMIMRGINYSSASSAVSH